MHQAALSHSSIDEFIGSFDRRTDVSFALLRIEMSYAMRQFAFSEHFCTANGYRYMATKPARIQFLERHMASIDQRYLQFCNRNDMFSFFQRNAVKLILSRHLMLAKRDDNINEVLHNTVMVLEAAASMRKTHKRWAWSLRSYVELEALELLWRCLNSGLLSTVDSADAEAIVMPNPANIGQISHGWLLASSAFQRGEDDGLDLCYSDKWARIKQLRESALSRRGPV
jgi:hypothetical protein